MAYLKGESGRKTPFSLPLLQNIDIDNYINEYTPTESWKEGTLLYIDKSQKYKLRKDSNLNKPKEIELAFTEILRPIGKNFN